MLPKSKFDHARELADHGFSVIPLKPKGKVPVINWSRYQSQKPTDDDLKQWFANFPERNIGIVTGAVSGLVVVDVDKPEAFHMDMPRTPTVKTGKGLHYYFKHPGFDVGNASLPFGDLRGDGGQVVAPPSTHPDGATYEWIVSPDEAQLAELPLSLIELASKPSEPNAANDNREVETTAYGKSWYEDVDALALIKSGNRNNKLNEVACKAGSLYAADQLNRKEAIDAMLKACRSNGLMSDKENGGPRKVTLTMMSGFDTGTRNPRYPSEDTVTTSTIVITPDKPGRLSFRKASEIKAEKLEWLWPGILPKNAISILAGNPGLGKSQAALSVAATITSGGRWPVTGERAPVGNVIILSGEDSAEHTIIPRLTAAGADLDRVFILDMVTSDDGTERQFNLQDDIPKLREILDEIGGVSLIIIDVLNAYLAKADTNNSGDVRRITNDLTHIANGYDLCVLGLAHLNKGEGKQASHRVQGSISWVGAARSALLVERDEDGSRSMSQIKNNLAKDNLAFTFDLIPKTLVDGIETSAVQWHDSSLVTSADKVLADKGGGPKLREAKEFLLTKLSSGSIEATRVMQEAEALGIARSTLYEAKKALDVSAMLGADRSTLWVLPKAA